MLSPWGWLSQVHTSVLLKHPRWSASARSCACWIIFWFRLLKYIKTIIQIFCMTHSHRHQWCASTAHWKENAQDIPHGYTCICPFLALHSCASFVARFGLLSIAISNWAQIKGSQWGAYQEILRGRCQKQECYLLLTSLWLHVLDVQGHYPAWMTSVGCDHL